MEEKIQKFYEYLEGLLKSYTKLAGSLSKKIDAVTQGDLEKLSDIMKDEQAYVLLSRGFDEHVKGYQEGIGVEGDTLSDIIPRLPAECQTRFRAIYLELRSKLEEVKGLNEICQTALESKLEGISRQLQGSGGAQYSTGKQVLREPAKGLFDRSI